MKLNNIPSGFSEALKDHDVSVSGNKLINAAKRELTVGEIMVLLYAYGILVETYKDKKNRNLYTLFIKKNDKLIFEMKGFESRAEAEIHALNIVFEL